MGEAFHQRFAHHARVIGCAARGNGQFPQAARLRGGEGHALAAHGHFFQVDIVRQRVLQSLRLVEDLFEHEVVKAVLLRGRGVPCDGDGFAAARLAVRAEEVDACGRQHADVAVLERADRARVPDQRRHVAGDVVFALAQARQQRAVPPRAVQNARRARVQHAQRIRALQHGQHAQQRGFHVGVIVRRQQLGDHLRVRLGGKVHAALYQLRFQLGVIFDDAVVHHGDASRLVEVRVRIFHAGLAVRGPARVADAGCALHAACTDGGAQVGDTAHRLAHAQRADLVQHGDARRIVPAVLQFFKAVQQKVRARPRAGKSNDAAHSNAPLPMDLRRAMAKRRKNKNNAAIIPHPAEIASRKCEESGRKDKIDK